MMYREPTPSTIDRTARLLAAGLLVLLAASAAALAAPLLMASAPAAPSESLRLQQPPRHEAGESAPPTVAPAPPPSEPPRQQRPPRHAAGEAAAPGAIPRDEHPGALDAADGLLPDGATVFADGLPGVANLDPALLEALRQAAAAADDDGVAFFVTSGWRSPAYQDQLLREAVSAYGSEAEAARWVAAPDKSPHVSGAAVDIGAFDAMAWLSEHGAAYGLCQIYANEPWHYELRPAASADGCPPLYADPTHDPRMQQ